MIDMAQLLNLKLSKKSRVRVRLSKKKKISTDIDLDLGDVIEAGKKLFAKKGGDKK